MVSTKLVGGILWENERLLLGKRASDRPFYPGVWDIIGGHCKEDESLEQTLIRELKEEIGVTPVTFKHIQKTHLILPESTTIYEQHVYLVNKWTGSPYNRSETEHSEIAWFSIDDACRLNLADPSYANVFQGLEIPMPGN